MKYKLKTVCDVCGEEINLPTGRMEWGYEPNEVRVCHHKCSMACKNAAAMVKDIELDSDIIPPAFVYDMIFDLAQQGEITEEQAKNLTERLFEK